MLASRFVWVVCFWSACTAIAAPKTPEEFIGHPVAADYKLARWEKILAYFEQLDEASPRVKVTRIGTTTEGLPMIVAAISAEETIAKLEEHQKRQQQVADPRKIKDAEAEKRLVEESKVVLLYNCNLHSSEVASSQLAMELAYELTTEDSPRTKEILDRTILLLIPSANPDGLNKVIDWYEPSRDKPWEGTGMPWLYQKYAGHDNNRDWFMQALVETKLVSRVMYKEWFPTIVYDIHQMGNSSVRFFVPPFFDPKNANVHPLIDQSLMIIGGNMAADLAREGKKGVIHGAFFDNWWAGGFRATSQRHNMVGLLTEAASPMLATPVFQRKSDLKGGGRGMPHYATTTNFPDPWPGGWWRLRDVADYEKIACYSLLTLAARYRDRFQSNYIRLGREALTKGKEEPPYAWLLPPAERDQGTLLHLLRVLHDSGIEVHRAEKAFMADGAEYAAGTYVLYTSQPYRMHLNDLMELQHYPERSAYAGGPPETPYDIAGWTLPLQMGVRQVAVSAKFDCEAKLLESIPAAETKFAPRGDAYAYLLLAGANDDYRLLNRLQAKGITRSQYLGGEWKLDDKTSVPAGSVLINDLANWNNDEDALLKGIACRIRSVSSSELARAKNLTALGTPRLALYQPWTASMDEGWTRWVLDHFEYKYASLHNAEVRAGNLRQRYDCIVLPSLDTESILNGREPDTTAQQYVGGLGREGVIALQEFLHSSGTLVCIDDSCNLPIDEFGIPVKNIVAKKKKEEFYCPGSILRVSLEGQGPLTYGLPPRPAAYFVHSQAFEVTAGGKTTTIGRYADSQVLQSGYLRGTELIRDKPAILSVKYGQGTIVLFGFRIQHRAQPHGTFRLLFNAIQASTMDAR